MEWTFVWMMVVLKIPVVAAIWLVWWAMKAEPELADEGDGGIDVPDTPPRGLPPRPRRPRRGPHGEPEAPAPPRVRTKSPRRARTDA